MSTTYEQYKRTDQPINVTVTDEPKGVFENWCLPLIIFVIIAVISILAMIVGGQSFLNIIISIIFNVLIGLLIWWLCKNNHIGWAWVILFLPLILTVLLFLFFGGLFALGAGAGAVTR